MDGRALFVSRPIAWKDLTPARSPKWDKSRPTLPKKPWRNLVAAKPPRPLKTSKASKRAKELERRVAAILAVLAKGEASPRQVAERAGISETWASTILRRMFAAKLLACRFWRSPDYKGGPPTRLYRLPALPTGVEL